MFNSIAEDVAFLLLKKKILDVKNREIYVYALEVLLLNLFLLITLFVISVLLNQIVHFLCYVFFFIPLRIFLGGYHSKKSENCFLLSVTTFIATILILKYNLFLYEDKIILCCTFVIMIIMFLFLPVENINHPLSELQKKRNKIIVRVIFIIDFTFLLFFINNGNVIASREIIFILLNGITFFVGKINNLISSKKLKY